MKINEPVLQGIFNLAPPNVIVVDEDEEERKLQGKLASEEELERIFQKKLEDAAKPPGAKDAVKLPRAEDNPNNQIGLPKPTVKVGDKAPDFSIADTGGKTWNLTQLRGQKGVLITFFPKCFTGGCANHLSSLRDVYSELQAADIEVMAVSVDSAEGEKSQKEFARHWKLPFSLIPDIDRTLSMLYGAAQNNQQLAARMSILIDKNGIVRYVDTNVNIQYHGADMLAKIRELGLNK